ncbi:hypothetical protein FE257_007300 [Aspergillus nanangensis]|uniref:Xylanolytic transcriptional activator regulatory domain-containing protein n=1 Tax=Aspergillus nanangensis TaxID=2582783 RepID=A0AAD4CMS1_ASPNN|nr:hypothetical protein FE257_007300 [Aspergillus nanangensis]
MPGSIQPDEPGLLVLGGVLASREAERELFRIFLHRVDPFFKILHGPSLNAFMINGKSYLDYEPGHAAPRALSHAIYYAAAGSLDDEECSRIFKKNRTTVVELYRKESETALAQADFMVSNDLTVLQAFVLFLLASRTQDQTRRTWTMLSMAVRIAQALYLHLPDPPFTVSPFEREMRRRLWAGIGFLDVESSLDRASEPMMHSAWVESHPPLNINDSDISFDMETTPIAQAEGFTDMTFTMIVLKAQYISRLINFSGVAENTVNSIAMRQHIVIDFQHSASRYLQHAQPDKIAFHWFTRAVAELINSSMQLITLRPLQRIPGFVPPPVRGDRLLKIAVDVLKKSNNLRNDPRSLSWHWIQYTFVPWHALAVALAELCGCDELTLMEKFWAPVDQAYKRLGSLVADSRKGALWRPMEKMMTQANAKRNELLSSPTVGGYPSNFQGMSSSQVPVCAQSDICAPITLAPLTDQNSETYIPTTAEMTIPQVDGGLGPWPCVWDAIDFGNSGLENEMSWLNYENFIGGFYENIDYSLIDP